MLFYSLSKLTSEKKLIYLINKYSNIPYAIYRPGFVSTHRITGFSNLSDADNKIIRGTIECKCIPKLEKDATLDMIPVDYLVKSLFMISFHPDVYVLIQKFLLLTRYYRLRNIFI